MVSSHKDHKIRVFDVGEGRCVARMEGHPRTPFCIKVHPQRPNVLASACYDGCVKVWVWEGGEQNTEDRGEMVFHTPTYEHRVEGGAVSRERGRANTLELGLGRSLPVGAIESGRTGLGGYDFEGNVWEWLADKPGPTQLADNSERGALKAGGSFATYRAGPREDALREAGLNDRASDVGFRVLAEALPWLHDQVLPRWRTADAEERKTMAACVALWGAELRVQLERRWRQAYPEEAAFADFLAGKGSRS